MLAQLTDFIGGSQSREAKICSVCSDSSSGRLPSCLSRADANFLQTVTARLPGEVDRGLTPKTAAMMNYPV
jgi:hypothetical protein